MPNRKTAKTRKLRYKPKSISAAGRTVPSGFLFAKNARSPKRKDAFAIRLFLGVFYDSFNIITLRQQLLFPLARLFL